MGKKWLINESILNKLTLGLINITENLPDALEHGCSACSEKQKEIADKISHYLIDHRAEDWSLLEARYDPSGAYRQRYLQDQMKEKSID